MIILLEMLRDRMLSPVLRYKRWRHRKSKLKAIRLQWRQQQNNSKIQQQLNLYGTQQELMEFEMFGKIPGRMQ